MPPLLPPRAISRRDADFFPGDAFSAAGPMSTLPHHARRAGGRRRAVDSAAGVK